MIAMGRRNAPPLYLLMQIKLTPSPSLHLYLYKHSPHSLDTIANLELATSGVDERRLFAHGIARDLWSFICSFAQQTQQGGQEVVSLPANAMDLWLERFDRKYKIDPSFMLK